jgi:hypothetical protein
MGYIREKNIGCTVDQLYRNGFHTEGDSHESTFDERDQDNLTPAQERAYLMSRRAKARRRVRRLRAEQD